MLIEVTKSELEDILIAIHSEITSNEQNCIHPDNSIWESLYSKLNQYDAGFEVIPDTWIVNFQLDTGVDVLEKTAVCKAEDQTEAEEYIRNKFEIHSDETVTIISAHILEKGEVTEV